LIGLAHCPHLPDLLSDRQERDFDSSAITSNFIGYSTKRKANHIPFKSYTYKHTDIWNDLSQELAQAKTVKSFEILLDKYWENQEVKYDYNEEIKGFGMVTCTVSPLSRFTTHLLPVYRATYK
jgi:hypothetical protein